jgi:hypothetical protein
MYAYSNNGTSFRMVDSSYVAQSGEVLFPAIATPTELTAAFSGYAAAVAAAGVPAAAAAALSAGLTVTSTGTPALNGTYACDSNTTANINAEITSIMLNATFADGTTSLAWPDTSLALHTFNITQFKAFSTDLAAFVSGVRKYAMGINSSLPSSSVTIA